MKTIKAHCLFEQSGTFKKEFNNLGIKAIDYDIQNQYNQTDKIIDLFKEIEKAYDKKKSIFDNISNEDIVIAFFPCERFENQIQLWLRGDEQHQKHWQDKKKIEYALNIHKEINRNYELFAKLCLIAIEKNIKLIIENPYSEQHYLRKYFPIKPKIIDYNRRKRGDYMKKPTQYYFINIEPANNFIFEAQTIQEKRISNKLNKKTRSEIAPTYANRFIREFILKE